MKLALLEDEHQRMLAVCVELFDQLPEGLQKAFSSTISNAPTNTPWASITKQLLLLGMHEMMVSQARKYLTEHKHGPGLPP